MTDAILFVCTGNLCRSPMAAAFMNERLRWAGVGDFSASSAGTWASEGAPLPPHTRAVLAERGLEVGDHRAHNVTEEDMAAVSLVLAMARNHVEVLQLDFPAYADKVHLFSEFVGRRFDVPDPYGRSLAAYRQTADIIETVLEQGYERIMSYLAVQRDDP
jgi:protein-tyrosine-phosphatase